MFIILVLLFIGLLYFIYKNRDIAPSEPAKDVEAAVVAEAAPAKVEEVAPVIDGIDELWRMVAVIVDFVLGLRRGSL